VAASAAFRPIRFDALDGVVFAQSAARESLREGFSNYDFLNEIASRIVLAEKPIFNC
jgi:hypothetical protein